MSQFDNLTKTLLEGFNETKRATWSNQVRVGDLKPGDVVLDERGELIGKVTKYPQQTRYPNYVYVVTDIPGSVINTHKDDLVLVRTNKSKEFPMGDKQITGIGTGRINPKWSRNWDRGVREMNEEADFETPVWRVSQNFIPDTFVDVVRLEHERRAKRHKSIEDAMRMLLPGDVIVIPDPADPKRMKIHYANWDS
jgi:hypothetical protein